MVPDDVPAAQAVASRPVWGAWIEMSVIVSAVDWLTVAPRMGRVD